MSETPLDTAREAAIGAGEILRRRFRQHRPLGVEAKSVHDFVTDVDREAEAAIVELLRGRFPEDAIMAEEGAPDEVRQGRRWIVDPLDGTTNFIQGVPVFSVSIALEDDDGLRTAVVHDPVHDETFHAERGRGAFLDGRPIACATRRSLERCVLATGLPFREFARLDPYLRSLRAFMTRTSGIRRAGSAALDLAFTACGRYDGFWETGLSPWDVAAGALLVSEAGGTVSDFTGEDRYLDRGEIVAAGAGVHPLMLQVTRECFG
jgi:myo-inositol-1(or 4)-monophosphatase